LSKILIWLVAYSNTDSFAIFLTFLYVSFFISLKFSSEYASRIIGFTFA